VTLIFLIFVLQDEINGGEGYAEWDDRDRELLERLKEEVLEGAAELWGRVRSLSALFDPLCESSHGLNE
jgi:hypothetical protein